MCAHGGSTRDASSVAAIGVGGDEVVDVMLFSSIAGRAGRSCHYHAVSWHEEPEVARQEV